MTPTAGHRSGGEPPYINMPAHDHIRVVEAMDLESAAAPGSSHLGDQGLAPPVPPVDPPLLDGSPIPAELSTEEAAILNLGPPPRQEAPITSGYAFLPPTTRASRRAQRREGIRHEKFPPRRRVAT